MKKTNKVISFILAAILVVPFLQSCDNASVTPFESITDSSSINVSQVSLDLDEYIPPADGIEYDLTPLELNKPLNFITRDGDKLFDGDKEFRFISSNTPSILNNHPYEQEDLVKTIAQMGGQVLRTYTFSVRTKNQNDTVDTYITDKGEYSETAFRRLDQLLVYANKYNVRVIIPFIDIYTYNGGIPAFIELYGIEATKNTNIDTGVFYSDKEVVKGFMDFVGYVLNRKNSISGVYYKDDPAILAWESGNEMQGNSPKYNIWMRKLCEKIKSIDQNHLIMDGYFGVRPQALMDENIDIVSNHFYSHINGAPFDEQARTNRENTKGIKPFMIGEFGFEAVTEFEKMYDAVISEGITGSLMWSIRGHDINGGFHHHNENDVYSSYHWPGFEQGKRYEEEEMLRLTYLKGYEIQDKKPKIIQVPSAPEIIEPIRDPRIQIKWKGSTGAYGYDFQRSEAADGPWTTIGVNVSDAFVFAAIMFKDGSEELVPGKVYYYRVRARSAGGFSEWSVPSHVSIPQG